MKRFLIVAIILATSSAISAQSLGDEQIRELKESFVKDASTKAVQNILLNTTSIKDLAFNSSLTTDVDDFFKYSADVKGITDQKQSGRCWMYTSMNELRPLVMKKYNISKFDFSHNYSYFWDLLEKSNLFLENMIRLADKPIGDREVDTYFSSPIGDGGVWNLFYNIATKYGVVPAEVMPETKMSNSTSSLRSILNERLRKGGYEIREIASDKRAKNRMEAMESSKMETLKDIYRVLALCLGEPPAEFTWRFKDKDGAIQTVTTTPKEFFYGIIPEDYNPDTYVMIMNDPTREYYKLYEIQNYRNTIEGINWVYLNLPNDVIKAAALKSLQEGEPLYASCDVGKQSNTAKGVGYLTPGLYDYNSLFGIDLTMDKKARILTHQSGSAHAMLIVACDTDDEGSTTKWKFENSWGAASGREGYLIFSDEWFDEYMFRIVINRKYLDSKSIESLKQKPILLPPWDYMS